MTVCVKIRLLCFQSTCKITCVYVQQNYNSELNYLLIRVDNFLYILHMKNKEVKNVFP